MDLKTRRKYFIKKSPASYKRRRQVNISSQTETCLTPLQRLERFKKVQQKFQSQKIKKRVHFSMDMEPEMSNENAVTNKQDTPQKILRPRKPQLDEIVENGDEHGSPVNGHGLNGCDEGNKEQLIDKKDASSKKPQKKILKEGTPLRDTPRELRRRECTPLSDKRGTPTKYNVVDSDTKVESQTKSTEEPTQDAENTNEHTNNSVIIEDSIIEGSDSKSSHENDSVNESHDDAYVATSQNSPSLINKDKCEASSSSPSIICLDSPSIELNYDFSNNDFKGRKPINSFSKFPGRTVRVTSLKRNSNDSLDDEKDRKRFAGNVESDQRKSSGWNLTWLSSPFGKAWSPSSQLPNTTVTSTPFTKRNLEDSMAVNYDENTKRSLDVSSDDGQSETQSIQKPKKSTCTIM